jgi:hypothetical protein
MELNSNDWPLSSIVLAIAGFLLVGTGVYFIFLRPPLLPEDLRFMGLTAAQLDAIRPQLYGWLTHVFLAMGGYILATGTLGITLAVTSFRQHSPTAALGVLIGGAASIGGMTIVNFLINSDFKWVLLGMASVWAASLVLFGWELLHGTTVSGGASIGQRSYGDR